MPNWCKGSLKVRGKISDLKEFVQQGLEPVSYIGDALEPLVFTTEDETSFFVRENNKTHEKHTVSVCLRLLSNEERR